jgi:hypothetical protein
MKKRGHNTGKLALVFNRVIHEWTCSYEYSGLINSDALIPRAYPVERKLGKLNIIFLVITQLAGNVIFLLNRKTYPED